MYRISGGCKYGKYCKDCDNFILGKRNQCIVYPKEQNFSWDEKRTACNFYYKNEYDGQMSIMDVMRNKIK